MKGSDIIGLPVVTFDSGEKIEKVSDVVFDHSTNQVLAFLVDEAGWFSSARVVPFEALQTVGPDALIVPVKSAVVEARRVPAVAKILERDNVLKGTKIMTTDGRDLGSMRDLYFDEESGRVEGFEVSGGLFADAYEGRSFVPAPQTLTIGEDVAFVPPETAALMEEQVGGVKGAAQTMGDRIKEGAEAAGEKIQSGATSAKEKLQAGSETVRQRLDDAQAAATGAVLEEAKGRRAREAVRDGQGFLLVAPGQIVTEPVLERARDRDRESELLASVGLSTGGAALASAKGTSSAAGAELREGASELKQGAANLWEKVKEKVGDAKERGAQELEEKRINAALGRPVTRVIFDRQDRVILDVGELITHKAIEQSRQEGALAVLLDSVYKGEPEITQEDLRAGESGSAALEGEEVGSGQPQPVGLGGGATAKVRREGEAAERPGPYRGPERRRSESSYLGPERRLTGV